MADRLRTVKSSGGDYSSLSGWEAGEEADLPALDEIRIAECYAFADTTAVTISGWTTDATRYGKVTVPSAERHAGIWSTSKYRLTVANNTAILIQEQYFRFEYLQVSVSESGASSRRCFDMTNIAAGGSSIRIEKCIIREDASGGGTGGLSGVFAQDGDVTLVLANCLIYDFQQGSARGFTHSASATAYIYNCGFHNCEIGVRSADGNIVVKNTWAQDCTDGFTLASGTWGTGTDWNLSDIASDAPGANSINSTSITFVNEAGDDFHLDSGDTAAKDAGTDLSGDSNFAFSDDIDGATRSGSWDIGPDEITAAGGATTRGTPFGHRGTAFNGGRVFHGIIQ